LPHDFPYHAGVIEVGARRRHEVDQTAVAIAADQKARCGPALEFRDRHTGVAPIARRRHAWDLLRRLQSEAERQQQQIEGSLTRHLAVRFWYIAGPRIAAKVELQRSPGNARGG